MSTAPHHTQPPNQQRRATHGMTRHHTTKKQRHTRTRTCTCTCHSFCSSLTKKKKRSGTRTFHDPSTMVECSILDTTADMTNHTADIARCAARSVYEETDSFKEDGGNLSDLPRTFLARREVALKMKRIVCQVTSNPVLERM